MAQLTGLSRTICTVGIHTAYIGVWPLDSLAELVSIQRIHCCLAISFTGRVSINTMHTLLFGHQFHRQS